MYKNARAIPPHGFRTQTVPGNPLAVPTNRQRRKLQQFNRKREINRLRSKQQQIDKTRR